MGFQSFTFLYFLLACIVLFNLIPNRLKSPFLLLCSLVFTASFIPAQLLFLLFLVLFTFYTAKHIPVRKQNGSHKAIYLFSLFIPVLFLLFFKYFGFFQLNINYLAKVFHWNYSMELLKIIVPVGLSFLVFQLISYLIEVKRGRIQAETNAGVFLLYAFWFPKMMAGPIERPYTLIPQLKTLKNTEAEDVVIGMRQILWGFFQKLLIADRLALITSPVFDNPGNYSGFSVLLAVFLYSFQIYADFAGYTEIALGVSRLFGIQLSPNFRTPYFSKNIQEFWTRWHISLSSWLRDYFFLPLSYSVSRKLKKEKYLLLKTDTWMYGTVSLITMLICGIWHGAGWTFVFWGLWHGIFLVSGFILKKWKKKVNIQLGWKKNNAVKSAWDIAFTFVLVSFAWIFFRSADMATVKLMFINMFNTVHWLNFLLIQDLKEFRISLLLLLIWVLTEGFSRKSASLVVIANLRTSIRWAVYFLLFWAILIFGQFGNENFIYFQF